MALVMRRADHNRGVLGQNGFALKERHDVEQVRAGGAGGAGVQGGGGGFMQGLEMYVLYAGGYCYACGERWRRRRQQQDRWLLQRAGIAQREGLGKKTFQTEKQ